ncbi:MAG: mechanosensitive ion channel [Myxococcota bacterium]|nr:mechanosensitive ion channel [Myxococcales bacterium]
MANETSAPAAAAAPQAAAAPAAQTGIPGVPALPGVEQIAAAASPEGEGALAFFDPTAVPFALLVVVGTAVCVRLLQRAANRLAERAVRQRLLIKQAVTLVGFLVYGVAGVVAVSSLFELSAQAIFALSGTLAVAGGFLLKDVAEATVAGVSILVSRPFQVGDRISFGGYYGEVRDIGLRSVRLVTLDDNLVSIPSSRFLSEPVASANAGALDCMVVIPFYVAPTADHELARRIVREAVLSSRYLYLGKPATVLLSMQLANEVGAVIVVTAKAYVFDARHEKNFSSDVTDRVLRAFRRHGVELPARAA